MKWHEMLADLILLNQTIFVFCPATVSNCAYKTVGKKYVEKLIMEQVDL